MCECVYVCSLSVDMNILVQLPSEPREDKSLGTKVTGNCKPSYLGVVNRAQVPWKSSTWSQTLKHLPSSYLFAFKLII